MSQYRIRIHRSRGYHGYFWDVETFCEPNKKQEGYWRSVTRGGYSFTYWGAKRVARRRAKQYLSFQPFETIEDLK